MQRCKHKKSRKGCLECKRRHIRCDEGKPLCTNCITAQRDCQYRRPINSDSETTSPLPLFTSPGLIQDGDVSSVTNSDKAQDMATTDLNMAHLELLVHFSFDIYVPELEEDCPSTKLVLGIALQADYLMCEVLALSARHLSTVHINKSDGYLRQAVELQTRGIELFNNASRVATEDESVPKLLFSSILGRHLLVDTLARRDHELGLFLDRFIQGARVHRGVRAVTAAHGWDTILKSGIGSLVTKGIDPLGFHNPPPLPPQYEPLLSRATRLAPDDKEACADALAMVEGALDDLKHPARSSFSVRMIFVWPILLTERFIILLERRLPEAIAVLGRYAILLHAGKSLWQVKDAGPYLLNLISMFLGSDWDEWQ